MYRDGGYTARTSLGVGVHSYELDRQVMGKAVSAETDGSSVNFMHESAYAMALDESNSVQVFGAVETVSVTDAPADELAFITPALPLCELEDKMAALTGMTLVSKLRLF